MKPLADTANPALSSDALLRRLEWTVLRRLDGLLQGDWRSLFRGAGLDLADLREYQLHDDVRHIDWNVTARLQVPHVRQFMEDRDLSAWFLLDLSGSVDFGSGNVTKLSVSTAFVATLARVLTRHGNRVGALLYGQRVDAILPPGHSRAHVLNLMGQMRRPRGADSGAARPAATASNSKGSVTTGSTGAVNSVGMGAGTALLDLLRTASSTLRRRSLVFVVSDFISSPGWGPELARLAQRHDLVAVRLLDPLEMALPDMGMLTMQDAETGEQLLVDSSDPAFRARYAAVAQAREAELRATLAAAGADTLELSTEDDLLDALLRYAALRRQRARLKPGARFPAHFRAAAPMAVSAAAATGAPTAPPTALATALATAGSLAAAAATATATARLSL